MAKLPFPAFLDASVFRFGLMAVGSLERNSARQAPRGPGGGAVEDWSIPHLPKDDGEGFFFGGRFGGGFEPAHDLGEEAGGFHFGEAFDADEVGIAAAGDVEFLNEGVAVVEFVRRGVEDGDEVADHVIALEVGPGFGLALAAGDLGGDVGMIGEGGGVGLAGLLAVNLEVGGGLGGAVCDKAGELELAGADGAGFAGPGRFVVHFRRG